MPLINTDKLLHHIAGAAIVVAARFGLGALDLRPALALVIGALLVVGIAITKECYDETVPTKHTKDWLDAAATIAGGAYAAAVLLVLMAW